MRAAGSLFVIDERGDVTIGSHARGLPADWPPEHGRSRVCDLGHVEYVLSKEGVRIRLRPSLTSSEALARLLGWLDGERPMRVALSYFVHGRWHSGIVGSPREAARCVCDVVREFGGGPYGNVRRRKRELRALTLPQSYDAAIQYWRSYRDRFDPNTAIPLLGGILSKRYTLFERTEAGTYVLRGCGNMLAGRARKWLENAVGTDIQRAPDVLYAESCVKAYIETERAQEPCVDDVDGLIKWTGRGRKRDRYRRLMLPFSHAEKQWLVTASIIEPSICLLA